MNILPSVLRTVVPLIVGALITLALRAGLDIDSATLTPVVEAGVTATYYIVVRLLETHASAQFGWLLGLASQPAYATGATETAADPAVPDAPADASPYGDVDETTPSMEWTSGSEL